MHQAESLDCFAARLRENIFTLASLQAGERSAESGRLMGEDARRKLAGTLKHADQDFNGLALELFRLQFRHNRAYRKFCDHRGISAAGIQHWTEIPPVPAAAFKELEISCIPERERTTVFLSSGTTEQWPSRHFHNHISLQTYEASLLAWFSVHLLGTASPAGLGLDSPALQPQKRPSTFADAVLALTPSSLEAPHSSLVHMFETVRRRLNWRQFSFTGTIGENGVWILDCGRTIGLLQQAIDSGEPVMLLGTAFSFVHLVDYLSNHGLKLALPAGSRVIETGGYKGRSRALPKSELHGLITQMLGIAPSRIICEYGMSELSSQAYDRAAQLDQTNDAAGTPEHCHEARRGHFRFPPWAQVQVISAETGREVQEGETGLIRVFDLANVYSVMAVQTQDLAVRRGAGFDLIGRAALAEARGCSLMAP